MKVRNDGDFDVSSGESITITVQRDAPPCVAVFRPVAGCVCGPISQPDGRTAVKSCKSPSTVGMEWDQTIVFGFPPNPGGSGPANNHYHVTIEGAPGGDTGQDDVNAPPDPRDRTYTFHVS